MFIIVCFVSYMNKTGFGVMLYMYTYLPYVALCVRGERGERGVTKIDYLHIIVALIESLLLKKDKYKYKT